MRHTRAKRHCVASWAILVLSLAELETFRADAPPLETPSPDWDRGAGAGTACSYVQDGRSGDHVPYFRWSGEQTAVCKEPAQEPGTDT